LQKKKENLEVLAMKWLKLLLISYGLSKQEVKNEAMRHGRKEGS
jgi:hypothetical protein